MDTDTGEIDVENLFNEENLNNAALEGGILSENAIIHDAVYGTTPAQNRYLGDLVVNGSLNQLTWAKPGIIASISPDGSLVETRVQRFDAKNGTWILSEPSHLEKRFDQAVALAWNQTGGEIAVLDHKGRADVFNLFPTSINRFHQSRDSTNDAADDSNHPIGVFWLSLSRGDKDKKKTVLENAKDNGRWKHEHIEGNYYPPHVLRGFCFVTRSGTLTLLSTRDGGPPRPSSVSLPAPSTSSTFTHAAITQTSDGRLLIAISESETGNISTFMIDLNFSSNEPVPVLSANTIELEIPSLPPFFGIENQLPGHMGEDFVLTHFFILGESEYTWDHLNKPHIPQKQPPILFAVYSSYDEDKQTPGNNYFGTTFVKRWSFKTSHFDLHPRFGSAPDGSQKGNLSLESMPDAAMPAPITNIQVIEPGNVIATTSIDGSTMFWDSTTMSVATGDPENQIVSSVGSVSVDFPHIARSVLQTMSQHAMVLAFTDQEGKLDLKTPKYRDFSNTDDLRPKPRELNPDNPLDDALIACYILSFSRSCWQNITTYDDILSSIHNTVSASSLVHIRRQMFMTLFQPKSLVPGTPPASELERTPHSLIIFKVMAFNLGVFNLRDHNKVEERTAHMWAWIVLNLRWSITILGDTYKSMHPQNQPNAPPRPPVVFPPSFLDLVCHNIRWIFALFNYLIQSILVMSDRRNHQEFFENSPDSSRDLTGDAQQGLVALLVNHSWSRTFLLIMARLMKACAQKGGVSINFNATKPLESAVNDSHRGTTLGRIAHAIQNCCLEHGITVVALEALFDAQNYPDTWGTDSENWDCFKRQVDMMVTGKIPSQYENVVQKLHDECISGPNGLRARGEIDRLRLMEEMPDQNYVFLNMDDMAFAQHTVEMCIDAASVANGTDTMLNGLTNGHSATNHVNSMRQATKPGRPLYDIHKKLPLFSHQSQAINPMHAGARETNPGLPRVTNVDELKNAEARRCVRCGSVSDTKIDPMWKPGHGSWPRNLLTLMNRCICDGTWIVEKVGVGLHD